MKKLVLIIVIIAALAAVPLVYAKGHGARGMHGGHGFGFLGHLEKLQDELELSDAQMAQLRTIVKETHEQNKGFREQMHGTFKDVATTLLVNPNDVAGAQAIVDRQAEAERVLKSNLIAAASKAMNVLTPEQRTKLAMHLAERANRWENRGR